VAGERSSDEELLERIGAIGRELAEVEGLPATLQRIVDLGADLLDHCDGVSLMLSGKGGGISTPAHSSPLAYRCDEAQYATGQGPGLEAVAHERTIVVHDLTTEERWPAYRDRVSGGGVRSMISFRLFVTADSMGVLNHYSRRRHAFDRRARLLGEVFAAQASVATKAALVEAGLETSLRSRDVIGQAKGIVMARRRMTADEAFELLKQLSQDRNQRVAELAATIARTGELPGRGGDPAPWRPEP
jgi:hypothetical protein